MSQNILTQQLQSPDPKTRFQAVKQAARARDETLLGLLRELAGGDPDEQVRAVANKAVAYLQSGGEVIPPPAARPKARATSGTVDSAFTKSLIDAALSYQISGQRNKALKSLGKALDADPSLEHNDYYISVLHDISKLEGEEALALVRSKDEIKHIAVSERQMAKQKRRGAHQEDVQKSTWISAGMDLAIFTLIMVFGTVLLVLVISQSAAGVLNGDRAAWDAYHEAWAAGEKNVKEPAPLSYELRVMAQTYSQLDISIGLILGMVVGIAALVEMIVHLSVTHGAARLIFKGEGTLPYLIYKVVSLYNTRMPLIFLLVYLGVVLTFGDNGIFPMLLYGAAGLVSLALSFGVLKRVGAAYDISLFSGCLALVVGSIVISIVTFALQGLLLAYVVQMLPAGLM